MEYVSCGHVDDIPEGSIKAATAGGRAIALLKSEGRIRAIDNRCPHMGYPMSEGTLTNGIVICDWHNARFDAASGCTFDPWADDVPVLPVDIRDGEVYVGLNGAGDDRSEHWQRRVHEGMEQNIPLIMAKGTIALQAAGVPSRETVRTAALYGTRYRRAGWGAGLTILTAMARVLDDLGEHEQVLALYQGMVRVSEETTGSAPRIALDPLDTEEHSVARLKEWFRYFIEVRNADGAERTVLTAVRQGATPREVCDMMVAAATDHYFRDGGHTLDFINKSFELLEILGWDQAEEVLPTLVSGLSNSDRSEEQNRWQSPIDIVTLLEETFEQLDDLVAAGADREWPREAADVLTKTLLGDDPIAIVEELKGAVRNGAKITQLTQTLAYAASLRIAQFHTKNELNDWLAVLHTYTSANALHQCAKRAPSTELLRGVFHGAIPLYFERWFNKPAARLPINRRETTTLSDDADTLLTELLALSDAQGEVDAAGMYAYRYLSLGHSRERLLETLGKSRLREDGEFHSYQMLEAAFTQAAELDDDRAHVALVAATRYLAAHAPTLRALGQTATLALRLHRGEQLSADDPDEDVA
ncbi:MAG: Rieske (2Fe-2S) protein [Candidatus Poribacteria bacterium]